VRIAKTENDVVEARSNFLAVRIMHDGETSLFATGRYLDRIDVSRQPFRFVERLVILDSPKIDTLLVVPL
jgi:3-phenylpropionate/cinnamic acid dioxygenase small subunit